MFVNRSQSRKSSPRAASNGEYWKFFAHTERILLILHLSHLNLFHEINWRRQTKKENKIDRPCPTAHAEQKKIQFSCSDIISTWTMWSNFVSCLCSARGIVRWMVLAFHSIWQIAVSFWFSSAHRVKSSCQQSEVDAFDKVLWPCVWLWMCHRQLDQPLIAVKAAHYGLWMSDWDWAV